MAVEGKLVVCPQCGKKFKLKEGFEAKSFACSGCSATVWVEGKKPGASPKSRRASAGRSKRRVAASKARAAAPAPAGRRKRAPEPDDYDDDRPRRYQHKDENKTVLMVLTAVGILGCIGVGIFLFSSQKDKQDKKAAKAAATKRINESKPLPPANAGMNSGDQPDMPEVKGGDTPKSDGGAADLDPDAPDADDGGPPADDGSASDKPTRTMGTSKKSGKKTRRRNWAPPADLPHLESTPAELRTKIDEHIVLMMDPQAGRDSLDSKRKLIAIGKPAYPRILGAMAKIRDTITDVDSLDERLIESSLKLADGALREMDGYLNSYDKGLLRPGTDKRYIEYILKLHYKRWVTKLADMEEMPGPFDASKRYEEDEDAKSGPK